MQDTIKVEELSSTEYKISIEVSPENVDKKFEEFFKSIQGQTQVPGFRKGKAPVSRLKQVFGNKARPSVSQMLIKEYYEKALQENEINPVGNPTLEDMKSDLEYPGKFGFDSSYAVELLVNVLPKLDPVGYKNLSLDFPEHNEEDLFNTKMLAYREQFAEHNQVTERGASLGDSLVLDFTGFIDNKQFDGGTANGFSVEKLGQGHFIPGFEDQVVGMKVGETGQVNVTFPKEYRAEHLAGKEAKFQVTVQSIVETKLAEVDQDLAMMVGYESVDELNNHVKQEMSDERRLRDRQMLDHQIVTKLLEENKFDAPKSMVEDEKLRLLGKTKANSLPDKAQEELHTMAEYNVKRAIVVDAIYEKEGDIEVTPEQLNKMLEEYAQTNNTTKDELVSNLYNTNQMDSFVGVLRFANVVDFIIDNANKESEKENDGNDSD